MSTIHRSRRTAFGIALVLAGSLVAPLAVSAQDQALAVAPAAPFWDESSGYGSVEASRAAASPLIVADSAWDVASGYGAVERSRVSMSAMHAMSAGTTQSFPDVRWAPALKIDSDLDSARDGLRAADLATARAWEDWDETSGYGSVEANRTGR